MRQISRSWTAKLPALPSFAYGLKIRLLLLLGPASIEFRVLAYPPTRELEHTLPIPRHFEEQEREVDRGAVHRCQGRSRGNSGYSDEIDHLRSGACQPLISTLFWSYESNSIALSEWTRPRVRTGVRWDDPIEDENVAAGEVFEETLIRTLALGDDHSFEQSGHRPDCTPMGAAPSPDHRGGFGDLNEVMRFSRT